MGTTLTCYTPRTRTPRCPCCRRALGTVPATHHATQVVRRACPGCKTRWQVKVTPFTSVDGQPMRQNDFTRLESQERTNEPNV